MGVSLNVLSIATARQQQQQQMWWGLRDATLTADAAVVNEVAVVVNRQGGRLDKFITRCGVFGPHSELT